MKDIEGYIRKYQDRLSRSEKKIAEFIIANRDRVQDMLVEDIAKGSGTSGATVIRFCKTIGFKSFVDFKVQMDTGILYAIQEEQEIREGDRIEEVCSKTISYFTRLLSEMNTTFDYAAIEEACEMILRAKRIFIITEGGSATIAEYFRMCLLHIGIVAAVLTDATLQRMTAELITQEDLVIGMTHSGRIRNTVSVMNVLHEKGVPVIAVTGSNGSPVCGNADVVLASNLKHDVDLSDYQGSRLEEFVLCSILQLGVVMKKYRYFGGINRRITEAAETCRIPLS